MAIAMHATRPACHPIPNRGMIRAQMIQCLAKYPDARLAGSWASLEAHLPAPTDNGVVSLSDIDVIVRSRLIDSDCFLIDRLLRATAEGHGVHLFKVSVRQDADITELWNERVTRSFDKKRSGAYLAFWTLVGAIEAAHSIRQSDSLDRRAYALTKLFFKIGRNALMLGGRVPTSYRGLADDISTLLSAPQIVRRALHVKLGLQCGLLQADADEFVSEDRWLPLIGSLIDDDSIGIITVVLRDAGKWYSHGLMMPADHYLQLCSRLAFDRAMAAAHARNVDRAIENEPA